MNVGSPRERQGVRSAMIDSAHVLVPLIEIVPKLGPLKSLSVPVVDSTDW